jgi:hypothetical protein
MIALADRWNRSGSEFLICYHGPKDMVDTYEFSVQLVVQLPTNMTGSTESHVCYIYRRIPVATSDICAQCDPFFSDAWEMCKTRDANALHNYVSEELEKLNKMLSNSDRKRKAPEIFTIEWPENRAKKQKKGAKKVRKGAKKVRKQLDFTG